MPITVEAEVDSSGNVRLLEPLEVTKTTRAIVTLLEDTHGERKEDDGRRVLEFLDNPIFKNRRSYSTDEIEAQIDDARNSWE